MGFLETIPRILNVLEESDELIQGIIQRLREPTTASISADLEARKVQHIIEVHDTAIPDLKNVLKELSSELSRPSSEEVRNPEATVLLRSQFSRLLEVENNDRTHLQQLITISSRVVASPGEALPDQLELISALTALRKRAPSWNNTYDKIRKSLERIKFSLGLLGAITLAEQQRARQQALQEITALGIDPYPHRFERTDSISGIVQKFATKTGEELEAEHPRARVGGRIHAINKMGKAAFIRFTDGAELLQIYIKSNEVDERTWALFKLLDLGDFVGTEGRLFRTRTGELSIHAESLVFLAKALVPPPDKHYGLHDVELRHRQRYADLIANREVRRVFETRSQVIRLIRRFFDERGYIEVETPMLTPLPTGAAARPFNTHHNALDIDLYARIAPELYLKRLIVGGFEKVYEINRNFRNEGIDRSHNPEFTMLEWYEAYSEYEDLVRLTEELLSLIVEQVCEKPIVEYGEDKIDFTRPWKRMTMREAVIHYWPERDGRPTIEDLSTTEGVQACLAKFHVLKSEQFNVTEFERQVASLPEDQREQVVAATNRLKGGGLAYGYLLGDLFEQVAEDKLIDPTFITEFPTELSPLSKQNEEDPRFVDRFELFIAGMEIANGFCEINDPDDQRRRFEAQMKLRERGDDEAMLIDEDYIRALSYGMPPTAGEGVGIDRLVMILTNQHSIRDVILFPHMRPESKLGSRGAEEQG